MRVRVLGLEGCPNAPQALDLVRRVVRDEGLEATLEYLDVPDPEAARRERFLGSPSVQVNGLDIEVARRAEVSCHGCRMYETPEGRTGVPPEALIREALLRALGPKRKVLFLCTGNSCRSQMAEGWARHLRGDVVEAYSAGVAPYRLDPRAVQVMDEAGVDISRQRPKPVDALKDMDFDCVTTLCDHAREHCPLFPGRARLVHRGFDDPPSLAAAAETDEEAMNIYRRVRDEIRAFVERLPETLDEA